jgi:predicted DNA-binding transcriptional regulator AlpA
MTPTIDYKGNYFRDAVGTWRYRATQVPVPGARDLLLMDRFAPARTRSDEHGFALFERPLALTDPDLAWIREEVPHDERQESFPGKLGVPWSAWEVRACNVVGMQAPELHPQDLLSAEQVAALAGLSTASLMEYVRREVCPPPTVRQVRSVLWAKPIVAAWLATRRAVPMANPQHLVRLDRKTGRTAIQVGKVEHSPWSLVVTTDTKQPRMVNLLDQPLLSDLVDSPFRLETAEPGTRLFERNLEGYEVEIPVSQVLLDWVTSQGAGATPTILP